jgi:NADP-dependent 3-hydroxy acid dehydrogenase YdfG
MASGPVCWIRGRWRPAGVWSPGERERTPGERPPERTALPPQEVAALVVWLAAAPAELVLNEAIVSPLEEQGWP